MRWSVKINYKITHNYFEKIIIKKWFWDSDYDFEEYSKRL